MRLPAVPLHWVFVAALCGSTGMATAAPGSAGGGHAGGSHTATTGHAAASHAAPAGRSWGPRPGHGWHGSYGQGGGPGSGWHGHGWGWGGGIYVVGYVPWWWTPAVPFYQDEAGYAPDSTPIDVTPPAPAVSYRFFCPSSSSYYPEVPTCAVPWLRVVVEP